MSRYIVRVGRKQPTTTQKNKMTKQTTTKQTQSDITKDISYEDTDNKRIGMYVHRSGNASISIHNTESVKVGKWETAKTDEGKTYKIKHIVIKQQDGKDIKLSIFT